MKRQCLLALAAVLCSAGAQAAAVHVKPTTVFLAPGQAATAITVTNEGDTPLNAQIRVFAWDQRQEQDALDPTPRVVASPPMLTLAPKQSQSIRVVRVDKTPPTAMEAYRLLVDEIPDTAGSPSTSVKVQMRYSVPVFVQAKANARPAHLSVKASVAGNALTLDAQNSGEVYAQASNVSLEYGGNVVPVTKGLLGYVLPGKSMAWTLPVPAAPGAGGKPTRVRMTINGKEMRVDL